MALASDTSGVPSVGLVVVGGSGAQNFNQLVCRKNVIAKDIESNGGTNTLNGIDINNVLNAVVENNVIDDCAVQVSVAFSQCVTMKASNNQKADATLLRAYDKTNARYLMELQDFMEGFVDRILKQQGMKNVFAISILLVTTVSAAADTVVAPNDRATQSGNTFLLDGFENPSSFQTVYGARNFTEPVIITGLAFRMEEASGGGSFNAVIPRITIRLSTYGGSLASYNRFDYSANRGSDITSVFDAAVRWTTTDLVGTSPNPFDLKLLFSQPFVYDPAKGSLLMDYQSFAPFSSGIAADAHVHGDSTVGWYSAANNISLGNFVTEFTVSPIPEPMLPSLLVLGLGLVSFPRRRCYDKWS